MRRVIAFLALSAASLFAQWGGELRFCVRSDPLSSSFSPVSFEAAAAGAAASLDATSFNTGAGCSGSSPLAGVSSIQRTTSPSA